MASFVLLVTIFLLTSCEGSRAVTPVFVQEGNDLHLDVNKADVPEKFYVFFWKVNGSTVIAFTADGETAVSDNYTGRIELAEKKYSVILKNLQETDSGVYTARVTTIQGDQIVAEYKVTVQGPVSPVELTVDPVSSSSDSCNLTVTCRTQDSDISSTFRCVNQICSEDGGETPKTTTSGAVLHVSFVNHSIICNHSNQVSWTTNNKPSKIQDLCHQTDVPDGATIAGIAGGTVLACLLSIYCFIKWKKNKQQKQNNEYTVYAVPEESCPAQTRDQDQNQNPVTSTYALVDFHSGPGTTNITNNTSLPETIYAQVNRAAKSRSNPPPDNQPLEEKNT